MKKTTTNRPKPSINAMVPTSMPDIDALFPKKVTADRVRAILQLLFFVRLRMKQNSSYAGGVSRESGWCPLRATTLKAIAGKGYRATITQMQRHGMIQVKLNDAGKESFAPKQWSKLYRIHPQLKMKPANGRSYRREKITHPDVLRAVKRHYDTDYGNQVKAVEAKGKLYADIVRFGERFSIDLERLEQDIRSGAIQDDGSLLGQAAAINDKAMRWCTVDGFGKRLHTHLGNMPKALRPYLRLDGQHGTTLTMMDLKNSQPYFLSLLFYRPELLALIPEFLPVKRLLEDNQKQPDTRLFYEDCAAGGFYNKCLVILGESRRNVKEIPEEKKKALKEKLFRHLFYCSAGNHYKDKAMKEERRHMQSRVGLVYPSLVANLHVLKRTKKETLPFVYEATRKRKKQGKMYATPNCMAQRIESKVILELVAATMFEIGIPVFTIHDAFILEEEYMETLMQVIGEVFATMLKIKPPKVFATRLTTVHE